MKIDELIRQQCPEGVESVKVGDIAEVGTGKRDRKEEDPTGKYPLYVRSKDVLRINEYDYDETAIITPGEGKVGEVFHFIEGKYALHARAYRVSVRDNRILPKFLLYAFEQGFKNFLNSRVYTGTLNSIRMPMVKDFQVPAPLLVQQEIADSLDDIKTLTDELVENLEREAEIREKLYIEQREIIFDKMKTYPTARLGDIGTFRRGKGIAKKDLKDEGVPAIHYGQIYTHFGHKTDETMSYVDKDLVKNPVTANYGDLLIAISSESIEDVGKATVWLGEVNPVLGGDIQVFTHEFDPRYVSHYFTTHHFMDQKIPKVTGTNILHLNKGPLEEIEIPTPPLEIQKEIADHLDELKSSSDLLVHQARQAAENYRKGYSYALDRLFDFSRFN